jgi:hypothetical protein
VDAKTVALEVWRRSHEAIQKHRDRATIEQRGKQPARLSSQFARMSAGELLRHFRNRTKPQFFSGFFAPPGVISDLRQSLFPASMTALVEHGNRIVNDHCWPLLGLGDKCFGDQIDWHRDPVTGVTWPLKYHGDIDLARNDGSDPRLLWELNRLPHLITLARAYAVTGNELFTAEFSRQIASWGAQNPFGRGINWNCAMEAALRVMNVLGAFEIFRRSEQLDEHTLAHLLVLFDQHGRFIRENLEFSYIATSNHYLSDVVGLLWVGLMLPELREAQEWRTFGLREMLREMDKQVLPDGADFEASTGYHRFVLELFLYSFLLCRANGLEIEERYWTTLHQMLRYVRGYLRPDGRAPLIGDSDSGRVLPVGYRRGDDHAYVLAVGAAVFADSQLKPGGAELPEEILWLLGEEGVRRYQRLPADATTQSSQEFTDAGTYTFREGDLYLLFNASGSGINGRGSHGHNDALSLEVAACGRCFICDPGTYIYKLSLGERHRFRSTSYHSTVEVDGLEQNSTHEETPFLIGDEAHPIVLRWEKQLASELIAAEHRGYERLAAPVRHCRTVCFRKPERVWIVDDLLSGEGEHTFRFRFHFSPGLEITALPEGVAQAADRASGARLLVMALDLLEKPELEPRFASHEYGEREPSVSACWTMRGCVPVHLRWAIVPVCANDNREERMTAVSRLLG